MSNSIFLCILALFVNPIISRAEVSNSNEVKPSLPALTSWEGKSAVETRFKNIKQLTHLTEVELERVMGYTAESLGVKCTFCHNKKNFSLDDNPRKKRAREMIKMVQSVNQSFFQQERISCYTCHAGNIIPKYLPGEMSTLPSLDGTGKPSKLPTENFKNVQKLSHLTKDEYYRVMDFFVASVGAKNCLTCHIPGDFSSDELSKKVRAREMIRMVQEINRKFFTGERMTCYTCHQGNALPRQVSEAWIPGWQ